MELHDPYIMWLTHLKIPIARCRACNWRNTTTPFQAAARHLYAPEE